jgi:hypothetical protein
MKTPNPNRLKVENLRDEPSRVRAESARRLAHPKTLCKGEPRSSVRQLLDCARPPALWQRWPMKKRQRTAAVQHATAPTGPLERFTAPVHDRLRSVLGGLVAMLALPAALAQTSDAGLLYFALEDLDNNRVILRGTSEGADVSLSRLNPPPNARLRLWVLDAATVRIGSETFTTGGVGQTFTIPTFGLSDRVTHDSDNDGLSDLGEFILGSDAFDPDTNADGILDGDAVRQGLDPTRGRAARTGIVDGLAIIGSMSGVAAYNDLAIGLVSRNRISLFNIFNRMTPMLVGEVVPPGLDYLEVDYTGGLAVMTSGGSVSLIDVADPSKARITRNLSGLGFVTQVATAGRYVYMANSSREVILADMTSGLLLGRRQYSPETISDLAVAGDHVYVLSARALNVSDPVNNPGRQLIHKIAIGPTLGDPVASLEVSDTNHVAGFADDTYLFAGGGLLYVGGVGRLVGGRQSTGFYIVRDDGAALTLMGPSTEFTAYDVIVNGSGRAVFTQGYASGGRGVGLRRVGVADVSNPSQPGQFITSFELPSFPVSLGTSLTIYNGLAYVAQTATNIATGAGPGLLVVNYMPVDLLRVPPQVSLQTSAVNGEIVEGEQIRVTALATDDVQVRNVEFYLDGERVATDGGFPFEYRFDAPKITPEKNSFTLRARASDTAGQATFSDLLVIKLLPSAPPP